MRGRLALRCVHETSTKVRSISSRSTENGPAFSQSSRVQPRSQEKCQPFYLECLGRRRSRADGVEPGEGNVQLRRGLHQPAASGRPESCGRVHAGRAQRVERCQPLKRAGTSLRTRCVLSSLISSLRDPQSAYQRWGFCMRRCAELECPEERTLPAHLS